MAVVALLGILVRVVSARSVRQRNEERDRVRARPIFRPQGVSANPIPDSILEKLTDFRDRDLAFLLQGCFENIGGPIYNVRLEHDSRFYIKLSAKEVPTGGQLVITAGPIAQSESVEFTLRFRNSLHGEDRLRFSVNFAKKTITPEDH